MIKLEKQIYSPHPDGYFYRCEIYHEALLTYGQYLEKTSGEKVVYDPDDSTNYHALDWYKNGSLSFAEKEWPKFISRLRENIKLSCGMSLQKEENGRQYIYHLGTVLGLKGTFLLRSRIFIQHSSIIEMDEAKFMTDMTRYGRWENR